MLVSAVLEDLVQVLGKDDVNKAKGLRVYVHVRTRTRFAVNIVWCFSLLINKFV